MILSQHGNPYFLRGKSFRGIGGPHIGIRNAWPMSLLVQIMTTDDDEEIKQLLEMLLKVSRLGLVHESVNVNSPSQYTSMFLSPLQLWDVLTGNRELVCMGKRSLCANDL